MKKSVFKTEEGRDTVRAYYKSVLDRFPFGQLYVDTAFGRTFVLTAGQESNPPIVLLHGSCSNSAFWFPEIMALSGNFRVFAVDIIGEAGNSEEYRPDLNSDAFAQWMKNVLDALGIDKIVIIGNSLGGWMALKFATAYPERVSRLILLASGGLAQIHQQFPDLQQVQKADKAEPVNREIVTEQNVPKEVLDFINLIVKNYNPIEDLPVYTDDHLLKLDMPVLFIGGENDMIIDTVKSADRLSGLIPSARIRMIPGCGHLITNSIEPIIPFLMEPDEKLPH